MDVQLPAEAMDAFKQSVNWSAPDAAKSDKPACTENGARSDSAIHTRRECGPWNLHGQASSCRCRRHVASLLSRSKALPVYLPELEHYLLEYPEAKSENIQSEFYWEKVNFGLKPTLRIVQAIVLPRPAFLRIRPMPLL